MICCQAFLGLLIATIILLAAPTFSTPDSSEAVMRFIGTVRIDAVYQSSVIMTFTISTCARAHDRPEIALIIEATVFMASLVPELLVTSRFHVSSPDPTLLLQVAVRSAAQTIGAMVGMACFVQVARHLRQERGTMEEKIAPSFKSFQVFTRPAVWTVTDSALRSMLRV